MCGLGRRDAVLDPGHPPRCDRLPRTACAALRVQPETVLGWHRDLGRRATLSCARPRLLGLVGREQEHHHGVEGNRCGGPVALLASGLGSDDC